MTYRSKKNTNTENKKQLIGNFISLCILRGFKFLIPLITLPYLVRTIGLENFGLINFTLSLCMYFGAVIQFGFGITATRQIAKHRDKPVKLKQIYSTTLSASLILSLISSIVFIIIIVSIEKFNAHFTLYIFTLAFVVFQSVFPIWFFQGMEKMKYITYLSLVTDLIFLSTLFLFVKDKESYILVPLLQATTAMISFALALILIRKKFAIRFQTPTWIEIKNTYIESRNAFIIQLAPNLFNNSAIFLLGIFSNNSVVGVYAAASKIVGFATSFGYILSNTFLPYLSRGLSNHLFFQKIMITTGIVLALITFEFSSSITTLLFNANNEKIDIYIQWLSLSIPFSFAYLTYNINYLMLNENEVIAKNIVLYVSLFSFFTTVLFTYYYNIWGAIFSIFMARILLASFSFYFYKKIHNYLL